MTDYSHALDGDASRDEGLIETLQTVLTDDATTISETDAEDTEIETDAFRAMIRTIPAKVLLQSEADDIPADIDYLEGGRETRIENLRTEDDGKLVSVEVQVDFASEVYATPEIITYACGQCGEKQEGPQDTKTDTRNDPNICIRDGCRSQQFDVYEKLRVDKQIAFVSDMPDGQGDPDTTVLHLYDNHINTITAGDTIQVSGVVKHIPVNPSENETKEERELVVTHLVNEDAPEVSVTDAERDRFENLEDPVETLVESFAPHLVGLNTEKHGLLHLVASGHDDLDARTISHGLMIGDPSEGKSALLEALNEVVPKSIIASSESASGVGMTAAAEREERLGGKWICRAGALVKAHGGHAFVDELDEFGENDLNKLLTALQSEEVRVNKASINQTLPASTRLVGAANPKDGEFSQYEPPADQFDFPAPLLARMDLVYVFEDSVDDDETVANAIMGQFTDNEDSQTTQTLSGEEIQKYLHYVLSEYQPTIPQNVQEVASQVWLDLRDETDGEVDKRDAKSIIRLAIASARLNRRNTVTIDDVETAKQLEVESLEQVGQGSIDASVKYSGETQNQSNTREEVLATVPDEGLVSEDDLVATLVEDGFEEDTVRHYLEKHLNEGQLIRQDGGELTTA